MITVNANGTSHCYSCDGRDALLVNFDSEDECVTLCETCGVKLVKAVSAWLSLTSPKAKRDLRAFFGGKK